MSGDRQQAAWKKGTKPIPPLKSGIGSVSLLHPYVKSAAQKAALFTYMCYNQRRYLKGVAADD